MAASKLTSTGVQASQLAADPSSPTPVAGQQYFNTVSKVLRVFNGVGAEKFAEHAWQFADKLIREATNNRCWCESAECAEHGANSAIYTPYHTRRETYKED